MTDEINNNKPEHYAYAVRETAGKSYFTRIGAAFAHAKGGGMTIDLDAVPVDGRLVLFPPREDNREEPGSSSPQLV